MAAFPPSWLLMSGIFMLSGCSNLQYYNQTVQGHIQVMQQRQPLQQAIDNDEIAPQFRHKLRLVQELLSFAHGELMLPDNGSYRVYADIGRPFVTWNVFAAPELSLQARRWCYPLVGCMEYRGYFSEAGARNYADKLQQMGWEVYVGGARAYSTLGWFQDPVLNTMLDLDDWQIARLIFHELAHQKLYLEDRTPLNEAFAESVARIGLERWLQTRPAGMAERVQTALLREDSLFSMLLDYRQRLDSLYRSGRSREELLREKDALFARLLDDYRELKRQWQGDGRYDRWLNREQLNNAQLVAISTYRQLLPDFLRLYRKADRDLEEFYRRVEAVAECPDMALQQYRPDAPPDTDC